MKLRIFIAGITLSLALNIFAIRPEVITDHGVEKAYTSDTLVYYGLDFSQFYLLNELKLDQGEKIKDIYAPVWVDKFNEEYDEKRLEKLFGVEHFVFDLDQFEGALLSKNQSIYIVRADQNLQSLESIKDRIANYNLDQTDGTGVSLLVEEFNKSTELVSIVFTFFDIKTREVLYAARGFGRASGTGMEWHWRTGLTDAMYDFMLSQYNIDRRKIMKKAKKN